MIRVHHVGAETNADTLLARIAQGPPSVAALDTQSKRGGGSGRTFDWAIAAAIARIRPIMLSGGLTPDNVANAIDRVHPWAVDVASGVERRSEKDGRLRPGVKSPDLVRSFIQNVRDADEAYPDPVEEEL